MLLYYITDRTQLGAYDDEQRAALLIRIAEAARAGVDYIQLREKDLPTHSLELLGREALDAVRKNSSHTKLLINARPDVALAVGADGVHLPAQDLQASEVRSLWMKSSDRSPIVGVSAHSSADVRYAEAHGANFAVLAPIYEKADGTRMPIGLAELRESCSPLASSPNTEVRHSARFSVLALGGVTLANAVECLDAGAAGIAGIRLFQSGDMYSTVEALRGMR